MLVLLRKALFWTHLTVGVAAGIVIFIMSVTGVLLTYQKQMVAFADRSVRIADPAGGLVPTAALLATAAGSAPDAKPASLTFRRAADAPVAVAIGSGRTMLVNPYSGTAMGEGSPGVRKVFRFITDAHRWLAMNDASRDTARKITGAANLGFLFLVLSGMFLWLPRVWRWTNVRAVLLFKGGLRGKARDFNWHHVAGIWCALPLALVVASGAVISYPWASALVYRAVGEKPPAPAGSVAGVAAVTSGAARDGDRAAGVASVSDSTSTSGALKASVPLDALVATARAHADGVAPAWRTISVPVPDGKTKRVTFTIDEGSGGQPQLRQTLVLDRATGDFVSAESFATQSRGRRLRSFMRFAHTGEFGGIPGQTIAGIASLAAALLVWTGLALSLRRLRARVQRSAKRQGAGFRNQPQPQPLADL